MKNKMMGSALAIFMAFILTFSSVCAELESTKSNSQDISGHWAKEIINKWVNLGIVSGYQDGQFYPNKSITRAEFIALVSKVFNFVEDADTISSDVPQNSWYKDAISKAVAAGLIQGDGDGKIRPTASITRQEAAVILFKAFQLTSTDEKSAGSFKDALSISAWAKTAVSALNDSGYLNGRTGNIFAPKDDITRAETLALLDNLAKDIILTKGACTGTKVENLIVNTGNVLLKDMIIQGDLYLTQGVGDANITLENVIVKGRTIILGGGENSSIIIINSSLEGNLLINKKDGKVRVVAQGSTDIPNVMVQSGVQLEDETVNNKGFKNVHILEQITPGQTITMSGDLNMVSVETSGAIIHGKGGKIEKVVVNKDAAASKITVSGGSIGQLELEASTTVQLTGGTVDNLHIGKTGANSNIHIDKNAAIVNLTADSPSIITGEGNIGHATINVPGIVIEQQPIKVDIKKDISALVDGKIITGLDNSSNTSGSGSGSGSGSDNVSNPVVHMITGVGTASTVLQLGETTTRTAITAEAKTITWFSSITTVAAINTTTGAITAIGAGITSISYQSDNGHSNSISVTVYDVATNQNPLIGTIQVLEENVIPTGFAAPGIGQSIAWSSSDLSKATVATTTGKINAIAAGDVTISYKLMENSTGRIIAKGSTLVTIQAQAAGALITGVGTLNTVLQIGEVTSRTAFSGEEGTKTWSSSNPDVATIDALTGEVTAIAAGNTEISYLSGDGRANSILITVFDAASIQNPIVTTIPALESDVTPAGYIAPLLGQEIIWSSSDQSKATVNASTGIIHTVAAGDTKISYKTIDTTTGYIVAKGSTSITVLAATLGTPVTGIGTAATVLQIGETINQTAAMSQGGTKTWSSSNTSVATIDASTGSITAIAAGNTEISYLSSDGRTNSISITVYGAATIKDPTVGTVRLLESDITPTDFIAPSIGQSITWYSSDISKATVDVATGSIHAIAVGNTTISYTAIEPSTGRIVARGSAIVVVQPKAPGAVITDIGTITTVLQIGETISRTAATSQGGTKTWSSSNPDIASIDASMGSITAIAAGNTEISYLSSDGKTNSILITVFDSAILKNPNVSTVQVLESDITPTDFVLPSGGQSIIWSSSDLSKAAVNATTGIIHAIAAGNTEISYKTIETTSGYIVAKGSTLVTVKPQAPGAVITGVGTINTVLQIGETISRTAFSSEEGTKTWSSSNPDIASIAASTGIITAIAAGNTEISYLSSDGRTNSISITVYGAAAIHNPSVGTVQALENDVIPTGYMAPALGQEIIWTSSNTNMATVNTTTGNTHAVAAGDTTISYKTIETTTGYIVAKGSISITVLTATPGSPVTGIGTAATVLQIGETINQIALTAQTGTKTWSSSNTGVATINASTGSITAIVAGNTEISYLSDGRTNSISITVYGTATIKDPTVGTVRLLESDITPTDFMAPSVGQSITWYSSDSSKATVDADTGSINAVAAGNTTISYKTIDTSTGQIVAKGSAIVAVEPIAQGLSITGIGDTSTILQMGETTSRTAATAQTGILTWSSDNPSVAGINSSTGEVTAISSGTAVISYFSSEKRISSVSITVYTPAIIANPVIGKVQIAESDVVPTGITAPTSIQSILWSSSDTNKATANSETGLIHAVAAGDTTIGYVVTETATGRIVSKGNTSITVYTPVPLMDTLKLAEGADLGETQVTNVAFTSGITYKYKLQSDPYTPRPYIGMTEPAGFSLLTLNTDIPITVGQHMVVIALDAAGKMAAMTDHVIETNEVVTSPIYQYIADYNHDQIIRCSSSGVNGEVIVTNADGLTYSGPIAITVSAGKIYWASQDSENIKRSNIDGTGVETVLSTGSNNVSAITVDATNGRIYWADYNANAIRSAKLDGSDINDIITDADNTAGTIYKGPVALTLSGQKIYWVGDVSGNIQCADLNGTIIETLVTTLAPVQSISSLAVDEVSGRIYWNEYQNNCIKSANLSNGLGITTVITNADKESTFAGVTSISIKNGRIYWNCDSKGEIRRARLDGSGEEIVFIPENSTAINGFVVH